MAVPFALLKTFADVGAGLFQSDAAERQAFQIEEFSKKVGESYDDRIAFVRWKNNEELRDFEDSVQALESQTKARAAANGLRISGSVLSVLHNNAIKTQRAKDRLLTSGRFDLENLSTEKRLGAERAQVEAGNARAAGDAAVIGGVASGFSSALNAFDFGGSAFGLRRS